MRYVEQFSNWLSSRNFFQGKAKSTVMQISFVMLIFLLFSDQISGGDKSLWGGNCLGSAPPVEESQQMAILTGFNDGTRTHNSSVIN